MTTETKISPSSTTLSQSAFRPDVEPAPQPQSRPALPRKPGRILIADDEHLAALSLKQCLRELGYEILGPARNGEHAIELAYVSHPDLALLDVRMADDFDGIDAARLLFEELRIPTVIVSAYSDARQVAESTIPGVFGYVVKPVTCEQLRPAIEVAWARLRQHASQESEILLLRNHIEDRATIDRAKRAIVEKLEVEEGAAMRYLRKIARDTGRSLVEAARDILAR